MIGSIPVRFTTYPTHKSSDSFHRNTFYVQIWPFSISHFRFDSIVAATNASAAVDISVVAPTLSCIHVLIIFFMTEDETDEVTYRPLTVWSWVEHWAHAL